MSGVHTPKRQYIENTEENALGVILGRLMALRVGFSISGNNFYGYLGNGLGTKFTERFKYLECIHISVTVSVSFLVRASRGYSRLWVRFPPPPLAEVTGYV